MTWADVRTAVFQAGAEAQGGGQVGWEGPAGRSGEGHGMGHGTHSWWGRPREARGAPIASINPKVRSGWLLSSCKEPRLSELGVSRELGC